jgi:hypothetical protein
MSLPPAPVNVRLVDDDGRAYPVEVAYLGSAGGLDRWQATAPVDLDLSRRFYLRADVLPPRCEIEVVVGQGPS